MLSVDLVNFSRNPASLIGIVYVFFSIAYLIFLIARLAQRANRLIGSALVIYIMQIIFIPFSMALSGLILIFQGWRLDPILQFGQFLLFFIIIYLIIKDIVFNPIYRNR